MAKNRKTATTIGWIIVESCLIARTLTKSSTARLVAVRRRRPLVPKRVVAFMAPTAASSK